MTQNRIFAHSPFIIQISESGQTSSKIEIFIWNGTGSAPASPTYTISKPIPSTSNVATFYDVSEYIKEFLLFYSPQNIYASSASTPTTEWCNVRIKRYKNTSTLLDTTDYVAFNGYGSYLDGYNPDLGQVSFDWNNITTYNYYNSGTYPETNTFYRAGYFTAHLLSTDYVKYTNLVTGSTSTLTVVADGVYNFPNVVSTWYAQGNKIEILNAVNAVVYSVKYKPTQECRYDVIAVDFVNKFGAWQRQHFFKASYVTSEYVGETYNLKPAQYPDYLVSEGQRKEFNVNAKISIKLNSGFVDDSFAYIIDQILKSEKILVNGIPVTRKTKQLDFQREINTKMINYTLEFEASFNDINNVN